MCSHFVFKLLWIIIIIIIYSCPLVQLLTSDRTTVCLDTTDENECNWLCLVRAAMSSADQNCIAYQLGCDIYYNTTRSVPSRAWLSKLSDRCRLL